VTYDVVVIGGGLNGLVVATYLAKAKRRVLVVERRPVIGGSTVTEEIAPGFRCDTCLHDAGWLSPRIARELDLERHGLALLRSSSGVLAPLAGKDHLYLDTDPTRAADAIRRFSPADAKRWPEFAALVAELAGFLEALYTSPPPRIDADTLAEHVTMLGHGRRLRKLGKTRMVELLRTLPMSVAELLDDWFESDALKGAVGAQGITRICQGPRSGGTAFVLLHHAVGRSVGAFRSPLVARGGSGALATAIAAAARASGVEIRTQADVAKLRMEHGRVAGVVLRTGEEIVSRQVASTADARTTFLGLCDRSRLDPALVRAVRNIRFRGAWAKMNLALNGLPRFGGSLEGDAHLRGTISIAPSLDYLERAYDATKYGKTSAQPYLEIRIPSLDDPSLAPAGQHVMSVHMQYAPYSLRDGTWDNAARSALGTSIMATLEQYAPGIGSLVQAQQVLSPLDLEQTFALPEGNAYQGEMTLDQILFMRPVAGWSRYRTPVPGLYLCGTGSHPGGAVAGGAGALAARALLKGSEAKD
jgi:phytoene dehydrogenase-like protein